MKIYQIELTNHCNFTCVYCPRTHHMQRPVGVMSEKVFDRVCQVISNKITRLHHYGESLLYPDLVATCTRKLVDIGVAVELYTNGSALTKNNCKKIFDAGMSKVYLSYHNSESAKHLHELHDYADRIVILAIGDSLVEELKPYSTDYRIELKRLRDLGQVESTKDSEAYKTCAYLTENEVVVLYDGSVVTCCEVYDNTLSEEVLGSVFEDPKLVVSRQKPIQKCRTCLGYGNSSCETEKTVI